MNENQVSLGEAKEKSEQKGALEKTPTKLSAKEKEQILKRYEQTNRRIESTQKKLIDCLKLMNSLPKDSSSRKRIGKLYNEAKKIFDSVNGKLPQYIENYQDITLVLALSALQERERQSFVDTLKKSGLEETRVGGELFDVEKDARKIVKMIEKLQSCNFSQQDMGKILTLPGIGKQNCPLDGLVDFMAQAKDCGLTVDDAKPFWTNADTNDRPKLMSIIAELQNAGITKDYFNTYKPFKSSKKDVKELKSYMSLQGDGFTQIEISDIACLNDKDGGTPNAAQRVEYFRTIHKRTGLGFQGIKLLYTHEKMVAPIIDYADKLKKAGLEQFVEMIDLVYEIEPRVDYIIPELRRMAGGTRGNKYNRLLRIKKFKTEYPDVNLFTKTKYANDKDVRGGETALCIDLFYKQSPETREFLIHVMRHTISTSFENMWIFLGDPALPLAIGVYNKLPVKDYAYALKLGRNLFLEGITKVPSERALQEKMRELSAAQNAVKDIELFEGRNLVFVAHNEGRFDTEDTRFGLSKSVGPQGTVSMHATMNPKPSLKELREMKEEILTRIARTPPPMTFYFSGHGNESQVHFSHSDKTDYLDPERQACYISVEDFAKAVASRKEKFPDKAAQLKKDIYIFATCRNQNFIRSFYERNSKLGGEQPITLGESEYGQYAFGGEKSGFEREKILYGLGEKGTTIGDVMKNENKYADSDLSIFVPNKRGLPQQIAENSKIKTAPETRTRV